MEEIRIVDTTLRDGKLRHLGMKSVVNLIYSISPRHTDEYYARKAREAAEKRISLDGRQPLVKLVEELTRKGDLGHVYIHVGNSRYRRAAEVRQTSSAIFIGS